ncbi:MAG TPA: ribosome small subunit-dependent GTPase A [Gemmatimonadaceae bacterium]
MRGVVLHGTGGTWHVLGDDGETRQAVLRGAVKHAASVKLAVGDEVVLEPNARGREWRIREILPRRSQLVRRAPGGARGERVVAANVDQVVVVFAIAHPEPHPRMLDRFLVIAEANGLAARVVINKIDLATPEEARRRFGAYEALGYPLHLTSCTAGIGLDELHTALVGSTSVLTGPSGVGKSSLMNAMYPELNLRVGEISASVDKGRHTTVGAFMHPLPDGGFVVDTPGLREVGLWGVASDRLAACFPEIRARVEACRFADCRHRAEPDCAVREAVARGEISEARYDSYVKLLAEAEEAERVW